MNMYRIAGIVAVATGAFLGGAGRALAGTVGVSSESGLNADATIDWSSLGATNTLVSEPFTISTSLSGLDATVSNSTSYGFFERRDQGNGWDGNFGSGESLLWTGGTHGPITLLFNSAVQGFGVQIQQDTFDTFSGTIRAYDAADNLLGSFTRTDGDSNSNADDSAIFLGILSDTADIRKITLSVGDQNFAINGATIQVVPLPPAALLGLGLLGGLGLVRLLRNRKQTALA